VKRAVVLLAILGLLTLPAAAQQKVTVYTTLFEPTARLVFAEFENGYGHPGSSGSGSPRGEAVARLGCRSGTILKRASGSAAWDLNHIEAKQKGLTEPYVSPNIENIPAQFRDP